VVTKPAALPATVKRADKTPIRPVPGVGREISDGDGVVIGGVIDIAATVLEPPSRRRNSNSHKSAAGIIPYGSGKWNDQRTARVAVKEHGLVRPDVPIA
jgi:hypothetical protein